MVENIRQKITYGRRRGRIKKKKLLRYKEDIQKYKFTKFENDKEYILDIGSGNGENTINLSKIYKDKIIIASEVYVDGNYSLLKKIENDKINNIRIFNDNFLFLLEKIKYGSITEIWILYPDPWPKKKHNKRRLIDEKFLLSISNIIKNQGRIFIATDSEDYFCHILNAFYNTKVFLWENDEPFQWNQPFLYMAKTSFFKKAQKNGKKSKFMIFKKNL